MTDNNLQQVIFSDVDLAVEALDFLRDSGIPDEKIEVLSGIPYSGHILGRKEGKSLIPLFAIIGFLVGFGISLLLNLGTPLLYPVHVGGFPLLSIPPTIILTFEISMLGLMIFTFLGVMWENRFPNYGKQAYSPEVSEGKIAVHFPTPEPASKLKEVNEKLMGMGADSVSEVEVVQ